MGWKKRQGIGVVGEEEGRGRGRGSEGEGEVGRGGLSIYVHTYVGSYVHGV